MVLDAEFFGHPRLDDSLAWAEFPAANPFQQGLANPLAVRLVLQFHLGCLAIV